jgi:ribulose-5-phosphate 4-epimerase/fuculose-1-phosphate aldolase
MTDYYPVGSAELHHAVSKLAPFFNAVLLRQHGVTVASMNLSKGMGMIEEIEQCCHIALLTNGNGIPITDKEKAAIDKIQGRTWPESIT